MARYTKEHKQTTRRRIIEAAGHRLKRDGIDGSGVSVLMADAGLTNGAFYAHFASKEELVATAVADQLHQQLERYRAQGADREGVEQLIREYLSTEHRDDPEHGCPSAALLDEIGRCGDATKHAYTDGVLELVDEIASRLDPSDPQSARGQTLSLFALLIGTLQLSRALADRRLADRATRAGRRERTGTSPRRLALRLHDLGEPGQLPDGEITVPVRVCARCAAACEANLPVGLIAIGSWTFVLPTVVSSLIGCSVHRWR